MHGFAGKSETAEQYSDFARTIEGWHNPTVGIVVTHFNYSHLVSDALHSVKQQDYANLRCVVVDDCSEPDQFERLESIVAGLDDPRFFVIRNETNLGQIPSFYRGMDALDVEFVALLDPDDRYKPHFVDRMLRLHHNPYVLCPIATCDQDLLRFGDGVVARNKNRVINERDATLSKERRLREEATFAQFGFHRFAQPTDRGWFWTSTSSNMFRRSALQLIRPQRPLQYRRAADAYIANGCHMLGGTLILRDALIYRGLHESNSFITSSVFSAYQNTANSRSEQWVYHCRRDVVEAFFANGGTKLFRASDIASVISAQFSRDDLLLLEKQVPGIAELLGSHG